MNLCTKCQKEPQLPYHTYCRNCMRKITREHHRNNVRDQKARYKSIRVNLFYKDFYWDRNIITKEVLSGGN